MSNFKIGEKVVCINDGIVNGYENIRLKKGEIYTSGGCYMDEDGEMVVIILEFNYSWISSRFRKLDYEFAENLLKEISESVNKKHLQN